MSDNPFKAPNVPAKVIGLKSGLREDLRLIALNQRWIIICVLFNFLALIGYYSVPPNLRFLIGIVVGAIGVASLVFVIRLAIKVYNPTIGIILGILACIPGIGLVVLLAVSGQATWILQQNGIKVGLLSAKVDSI